MKARNFIQTIGMITAFLLFGIYYQKYQESQNQIRCYNVEQEILQAKIDSLTADNEMLEHCWARACDRYMTAQQEADYYRGIVERKTGYVCQ